jgi:hypothetical protein
MCLNPSSVWVQRGPKWEQTPVPCKLCWRCKQNRINDFIGRSLAEAAVSAHSCAITLTYAPRDDLADKVVTPKHFQLFMKLMRRAGHKIRYLVAGEYGELKDRAHFHAILFFTHIEPSGRPAPSYMGDLIRFPENFQPFSRDIPSMHMVHIKEWPHGHVKVDWSVDDRSIRYVCEYVLTDKKTGWLSMSKKPPLGAEWFARKAQRALEFEVMPSGFEYLPPNGRSDKPYLMTGATRRDYLKAIYKALKPKDRTLSEWVLKSLDKVRKWEFLREASYGSVDDFIARKIDEFEPLYNAASKHAKQCMWLLLDDQKDIGLGDGIWHNEGNENARFVQASERERFAAALAACVQSPASGEHL